MPRAKQNLKALAGEFRSAALAYSDSEVKLYQAQVTHREAKARVDTLAKQLEAAQPAPRTRKEKEKPNAASQGE